ncbi:MAG: PIN domain-containing protein [Aeromonadaceae bacterium]
MANRILIINNDSAQELPLSVMDRFQQVMLVVGKGQNNLPVEVVGQLLLAQSQYKVQIELVSLKNTNKAVFDLHFAMHLGRLFERNQDSQFTILSSDTTFDTLIVTCKEQGMKINRVEALQRLSAVQGGQEEAAVLVADAEEEIGLALETPAAEPESASSRNHRLITSLIGGARG